MAVDFRRQIGRNAVVLEEDDPAADVFVLGPGFPDFLVFHLPDARDLPHPLRRFLQDLERFPAERVDDALGQDGTDALDQAAGQEFLDSRPAGRKGGNEGFSLELPAEFRAHLPSPRHPEPLAGRKRRKFPDDREAFPAVGDKAED